MKNTYLTIILLIAGISCAFSQQYKLSGTVKDTEGQPVSFASVYIKGTTKGTSANIDGVYGFTIDAGTFTIVYKAIGYKSLEKVITISGDAIENSVISAEAYTLSGVTISNSGEDPAYEIIRQAIKNRKKHLLEVRAYTTDVYIKGVQKIVGAPKKLFGRDIQKLLDLDTNRRGILYLSESTSTFAYHRPNLIHEEMLSSKTAGRNNAFSFNKASDLMVNFYENLLLEGKLSARAFVSPIADNALFYYRYKLLGSTTENGATVNKIQVIPRRENDPVFQGIIYIKEDTWNLVNAEVYLTTKSGINLIDTLKISQQFLKTSKNYMPSNINFQFNGQVLGFKFEGYYVGVYSNYNLQPNFPKNFFNGEILKITKSVNKKDSLFWLNNRPIPLTPEESADYIRKDSIALRKTSKHYLDSLEKVNNKFSIGKILVTKYTLNDRYNHRYLAFDPILPAILYNTVEGLGYNYGVTYTKGLSERRYYNVRPEVRYGFSNHVLSGSLTANYYYNAVKRANISTSFGSGIYDLNNLGTMSLLSNSINTLLFETNFSKFYQKQFANLGTTRELANGLQGTITAEYSRNKALVNSTLYTVRNLKDQELTSNNPFAPEDNSPQFPTYKALTITANLNYTFGQRYITRPDRKIYEPAVYPTIDFTYKKGIKGAFNSDVNYDLVSMEVYQDKISAGLWGNFSFVVGAGKFLNNKALFYPEEKHFRGNNSLFGLPSLRKFLFLDFYQYSTDEQYVEAHIEHNFSGFLTNKVPLLRNLKLEELIGVSYLSQPIKRNYTEFYFGLQRLIFRAAYGFAYDGGKRVQQGFRLSYGF